LSPYASAHRSVPAAHGISDDCGAVLGSLDLSRHLLYSRRGFLCNVDGIMRTIMRFLILIVTLICCLAAKAEAGLCPVPTAQPVVTVNPLLPTPLESHTASYHELSKKASRALKPNSDVMGLSTSKLELNAVGDFKLLMRQGRSCYYLKALTVNFGYGYRHVDIAREAPEGSCMFKEIRGHEYKHVSVDNSIVTDNLAYVEAELQSFANGFGPVEAASAADAGRLLTAALKAKRKSILEHVWNLENTAQDKIDSEAEYARVDNACRLQASPTEKALPAAAPAVPTIPPVVGGR
jgi:hypothetical protein